MCRAPLAKWLYLIMEPAEAACSSFTFNSMLDLNNTLLYIGFYSHHPSLTSLCKVQAFPLGHSLTNGVAQDEMNMEAKAWVSGLPLNK